MGDPTVGSLSVLANAAQSRVTSETEPCFSKDAFNERIMRISLSGLFETRRQISQRRRAGQSITNILVHVERSRIVHRCMNLGYGG